MHSAFSILHFGHLPDKFQFDSKNPVRMHRAILFPAGFAQTVGAAFRESQNIVRTDTVIVTQRNNLKGFHIIFACFVSGIYGLVNA